MRSEHRVLEGLCLASAILVSGAAAAVLPAVREILESFGSEIPWLTWLFMRSQPFFKLVLAGSSAIAMAWLAEGLGADGGLGARLRGLVPQGLSARKRLVLWALIGLFCLMPVLCFVAAVLPQFEGSLAGPDSAPRRAP